MYTCTLLCRDYREMPELDQYDQDDIDDEVEQNVTYEEAQNLRLRAERELDRRDAREGVTGRRQRLPGALEGRLHTYEPMYWVPESMNLEAKYCVYSQL